jgi:hypothetical protein
MRISLNKERCDRLITLQQYFQVPDLGCVLDILLDLAPSFKDDGRRSRRSVFSLPLYFVVYLYLFVELLPEGQLWPPSLLFSPLNCLTLLTRQVRAAAAQRARLPPTKIAKKNSP